MSLRLLFKSSIILKAYVMQKKKTKPNEIDLVIFDVNQTMFSLNALKKKFKESGLKQSLVNGWFLSVLKEGFSSSLSQKFVNFQTIGKNELIKFFLQNNTPYNTKIINSIFEEFSNLKVHPDIKTLLKYLKKNRIKIVTLTNGSVSNTKLLLKKNNINNFIDQCFSINSFKIWKPAREVYLKTCEKMKTKPGRTLMIAAHGWDINGAKIAGLKTAYITRYEKKLSDFYYRPDYVGNDSREIIKKLNF